MRTARATLISTLVASAVVVVIAYLMRPTPDWGTDDSGPVQGYAYIVLACSLTLASAALLFPLVALRLQKSGSFTRRRWTRRVMLGVVVMALVWSTTATLFIFGGSLLSFADILTLTVLLSILSILLLAPISPLWLWIAHAPKDSSANPGNVA